MALNEHQQAIKHLLYLNQQLNNRIVSYIEEYLLRNRGDQEDIDQLKESLYYVIDDQMSRIKIIDKNTN